MKYNLKKVLTIIAILCLIIAIAGNSFAHSGRTDSSGGHKDNKNKSGLGSYHYHCGGYPAHLHDNGVCPYSSTSYSSESTNNTNSTASTESSSSESVTTSSSVDIPTPISTPEPIIEAESVEINERISSMKVAETNKLTATITPENTEDKNITWKSNDEDIATVSSTGKVVALEAGMVNITATTSNGKTDTIEIMVEEVKESKEENKINNIVAPIESNELNNTSINTTEQSDAMSGLIGLGMICGGCYWGYRKFRK